MALCAFNLHFFPQRSISRRIIFQPFQALIGIISPAMTAFIFPEMNAVKFPRNIKMDIVSGSRCSSDRKAQRQTFLPGDPDLPATRGWGTQALSSSSLPGQLLDPRLAIPLQCSQPSSIWSSASPVSARLLYLPASLYLASSVQHPTLQQPAPEAPRTTPVLSTVTRAHQSGLGIRPTRGT